MNFESMAIMASMVVIIYPFNKLLRYVLKRAKVPIVSSAWLAFIILLMFQLVNLSLRLHDTLIVLRYIFIALPGLVFFLITDILRTNETTIYFRALRNGWFRWISASLLLLFLIPTFQVFIRKIDASADPYYIYSLAITIIYLVFYLRKPKQKDAASINNVQSPSPQELSE